MPMLLVDQTRTRGHPRYPGVSKNTWMSTASSGQHVAVADALRAFSQGIIWGKACHRVQVLSSCLLCNRWGWDFYHEIGHSSHVGRSFLRWSIFVSTACVGRGPWRERPSAWVSEETKPFRSEMLECRTRATARENFPMKGGWTNTLSEPFQPLRTLNHANPPSSWPLNGGSLDLISSVTGAISIHPADLMPDALVDTMRRLHMPSPVALP
jgi:hypothetical protein